MASHGFKERLALEICSVFLGLVTIKGVERFATRMRRNVPNPPQTLSTEEASRLAEVRRKYEIEIGDNHLRGRGLDPSTARFMRSRYYQGGNS